MTTAPAAPRMLVRPDPVAGRLRARALRVPGDAIPLGAAVARPQPLWLSLVLAAASGPVLDAAFPDMDWWPLVFPGIALVLLAVVRTTLPRALLAGFVAGMSFFLLHIEWATLFLGPEPWVALSTLEALYVAGDAVLIALAYRVLPVVWPGRWGRLVLLPAVVAGLWVLRESIASTWPYGGFGWGRVALSQSQSPFAPLLSWVGLEGLSFLLVFLTALAIEAVRDRTATRAARGLIVCAVALGLVLVPLYPTPPAGSITVAAVQGDGKTGYFDPPARVGDNLLSQVDATVPIFGRHVDVVVWPEGGSDVDPLEDPQAAAIFDEVSERTHAPLVAGAITHRGSRYYNTSLLWRAGAGAVDWYDKKHPVPFGEYVPDRAFWSQFAPDLIGLIQRDYTPGTRDSVFDLGHGVVAGVNICFDIADDDLIAGSVAEGAQVIFAQTNNADFGRTDESVQQLAIARVRAIETGRAVVNISTVGRSAVLLSDGRTADSVPWYTPATMVDRVPLATGLTPAVLLSGAVAALVSALGLVVLGVGAWERRRMRRA